MPTNGNRLCCAPAASGQATATAPSTAIKFRRLMVTLMCPSHGGCPLRRTIACSECAVSNRNHAQEGWERMLLPRPRCLLWVKLRNTQHEQMSSALTPTTDIGVVARKNIARIECYGTI